MDNKKIVILALILAMFGIVGATTQILESVTCSNCTFDNATFINTTFPINESNLTLTTYLKKDGTDMMLGVLNMGLYNITNVSKIHRNDNDHILFGNNLIAGDYIQLNTINNGHDNSITMLENTGIFIEVSDSVTDSVKSINMYNDEPMTLSNNFTNNIIIKEQNTTFDQSLEIGGKSVNNISYINISSTLTLNSTQSLPLDINCFQSACIPRYYAYNSAALGNYFVGIHFRGTKSSPSALVADDQLFNIGGAGGYDNSGVSSATVSNILFRAQDNWNTTSKSTYTSFGVTDIGQIALDYKMYLWGNGTLQITNLSGSGNSYPVRSDANGKLEVNRTAGAGVTMKSPDGNSWCLTITNGGTTLVVSGACP